MRAGNNLLESAAVMKTRSLLPKRYLAILAVLVILLGLYLTSLYSYLLFHALAETFSIVVAFAAFVIVWNSRRFLDNNYLLFVGVAFLFVAFVDGLHMLAYKGMGVFPGYDANLPTQLWIAARYMQGVSLLLAPLFLGRRLEVRAVFFAYFSATALLLSIFAWGIFPDCYIEGQGLTPFKRVSEYIISLSFLVAAGFLYHKRSAFEPFVLRWLVASMLFAIVAEWAFTFYVGVYDFANLIGHIAKIIGFYLVYKAIIQTALVKPYTLLFRELKQSEERVREDRDLIAGILDVAGALIVVLDPEGRIVRFNRACEETTGFSSDEVVEVPFWDLFLVPEEIELVKGVFRSLTAGEFPNAYENYWLTKDGERRLISWSNTAVLTADGVVKYVVGTGIDIAEQRRAEEQLRKLSRAVEQSPSTVTITDTEGRIEYVNPKFVELTGYRLEEVVGQNPRLLQSGEHDLEFYQGLWAVILAGQEWRGEFRNRKKSGELYWELASISPVRDASGELVRFVKVGEDITERKQREERLEWELGVNTVFSQLSRSLLSSLSLSEISFLVLENAKRLTGSKFGFVGYIDPETGYLVSPTLTQDIWDVCKVEDKDFVFKEFSGLWGWVLEQGQTALVNEPRADPRSSGTPGGHIAITRFLSAPALIGNRVVGQVALANADRDYGDQDQVLVERLADLYAIALQRHWAEETLRQRTAELEAQNKELDAFAHTVAHDLKNPLQLLVGYAELLEEEQAQMAPEEVTRLLRTMARRGRKMDSIINELLLLAGVRKMDVELQSLDMAQIVAEAQERLSDLVAEHQAELIVPSSWPGACGYAPWVEEVWTNYLSNAIKYGGRPPLVELGGTAGSDGQTRFWVRDNGPGLDAQARSQLFIPFTQLSQVRAEGHGLGLSIVRRIVEKLGGEVGLEPAAASGRGSVFFFTLPADCGEKPFVD